MKIKLLITALSLALLSACASIKTVKEMRGLGQGRSQEYPLPYKIVFEETVDTVTEVGLDLVEADRDAGRILATHGTTLLSWGENIAIFVQEVEPSRTEVEIVAKMVFAPGNFPPDWLGIIFTRLDINLSLELKKGKTTITPRTKQARTSIRLSPIVDRRKAENPRSDDQ